MLLSLQHIAGEGPHKLKKVIFFASHLFFRSSDFFSLILLLFFQFFSLILLLFFQLANLLLSHTSFFFNRWINKIWLGFFLENYMFFHICVLVDNEKEIICFIFLLHFYNSFHSMTLEFLF